MTADLAVDKLRNAVNPEKDRAQGANFGKADTEIERDERQYNTDIDASQIKQAVSRRQSAKL